MKDSQRKAMFAKRGHGSAINANDIHNNKHYRGIKAKPLGQNKASGTYTRQQIAMTKAKYGNQGTTKFVGSRCIHCNSNDATFKHKRAGGSVSEVRCIRCKTNAGM